MPYPCNVFTTQRGYYTDQFSGGLVFDLKILLVGNHTCSNRGDAAILRGTIKLLRAARPEVALTIMTRFPVSAEILIGETCIRDPLYDWKVQASKNRLQKKLIKFWPRFARFLLLFGLAGRRLPLPAHYHAFISLVESHDYVLQVGGSFLVDLYGINQFEYMLLSKLTARPIYLLGHSIGPFDKKEFKRFANLLLPKADALVLRELESTRLYKEFSKDLRNIVQSGDAAWLLEDIDTKRKDDSKIIVFTCRELGPFASRLRVAQDRYELLFAELLDKLIDKGYQLVGLSTCTPLDKYDKDDRIVAHRIRARLQRPEQCRIIYDELNDEQFMAYVSSAAMVIGTRLHSCIMSMCKGVPALALLYEHKSKGVMERLGLPELSVLIEDLDKPSTMDTINAVLRGDYTSHVISAVKTEANQVRNDYLRVLPLGTECRDIAT